MTPSPTTALFCTLKQSFEVPTYGGGDGGVVGSRLFADAIVRRTAMHRHVEMEMRFDAVDQPPGPRTVVKQPQAVIPGERQQKGPSALKITRRLSQRTKNTTSISHRLWRVHSATRRACRSGRCRRNLDPFRSSASFCQVYRLTSRGTADVPNPIRAWTGSPHQHGRLGRKADVAERGSQQASG